MNRVSRVMLVLTLAMSVGQTSATADEYILPNGATVSPLETFQDCSVCPEMIVLPMGRFTMGAPLEESEDIAPLLFIPPLPDGRNGILNETPPHEVEIDIPIAIGRFEVTYDEWMACVEDGACSFIPSGFYTLPGPDAVLKGRHPVTRVPYVEMASYTDWLNRIVGSEVYRLPTEAEWEYAARAGTSTRFPFGDTVTREQANVAIIDMIDGVPTPHPLNTGTPVPVDSMDSANAWGLHHVVGNVMELTLSCRSEQHLGLPTSSAYLDAATTSVSCDRVLKGGSYAMIAGLARSAFRGRASEAVGTRLYGFRILREMR